MMKWQRGTHPAGWWQTPTSAVAQLKVVSIATTNIYSQPAEAVTRGAEVRSWSNFQLNGLASQIPVHPKDNDTRSEQTHFQRIMGSLLPQGHSKEAL